MPRKRAAAAASSTRGTSGSSRKRAAAKPPEPGARELRVESGPPPELPPEPDVDGTVDQGAAAEPPPPPSVVEPIVDALEAWEVETVGMLLAAFLLLLHWTLARGGPPDAFVPDDAELRTMARPATRMLNRSESARRLARHGDGIAFAQAFGGFVVKETREVAAWRAAQGDELPDVELADVGGVREAGPEPRGPVRRWRPPVVEPDAPPS